MFCAAPFYSEFLLNPPHLFDKHFSPQPGIWQAPSYAYISCAVVPTPSEWRNPTRPPLQPFFSRSIWGPLKDLKRLSTPVTFSASSSCRQKRSNLSTPDSRNGLPFSSTNWVYSGQLHHHSSISLITPHRLAQTPATGFCPDTLSFFPSRPCALPWTSIYLTRALTLPFPRFSSRTPAVSWNPAMIRLPSFHDTTILDSISPAIYILVTKSPDKLDLPLVHWGLDCRLTLVQPGSQSMIHLVLTSLVLWQTVLLRSCIGNPYSQPRQILLKSLAFYNIYNVFIIQCIYSFIQLISNLLIYSLFIP